MSADVSYGLEQARIQLPSIVANAHAGMRIVITRHGKPYAAVVPVQDLQKSHTGSDAGLGLLALRGTGRGLWGTEALAELRNEWGAA